MTRYSGRMQSVPYIERYTAMTRKFAITTVYREKQLPHINKQPLLNKGWEVNRQRIQGESDHYLIQEERSFNHRLIREKRTPTNKVLRLSISSYKFNPSPIQGEKDNLTYTDVPLMDILIALLISSLLSKGVQRK